jgi:hypothetical protein
MHGNLQLKNDEVELSLQMEKTIHNIHQIADVVMEDDMNVRNTYAQPDLFTFAPTNEVDGTAITSI